MKRILVPIDFTPTSRRASAYAAMLARSFGAKVYLLHVYTEPTPVSEGSSKWIVSGSEWQQDYEARINKELDYLEEEYSVDVAGFSKMGYRGATINITAKELQVDLIVMGGKKGRKTWLQESTTLTTIRKSGTPVLIVPEDAVFSPIKHIVLASDFDEVTDISCYDLLFTLVKKFDATVQVLHVEKKGRNMKATEVPGKLQLQHVLSKISYQYQLLENDDVEKGLQDFVQRHPADLLVMVAHLHNFLQRTFGEIHTRVMSHETKLPLLVLEDK